VASVSTPQLPESFSALLRRWRSRPLEAERTHMESEAEQQRIVELELQQARYEASLAERRYAACDPDNRLIAAQLEKSWEAALGRVQACQRIEFVGGVRRAVPQYPER
jgi:hypothetical protein